MASRNRKKCDFFARGNCRKGNQCKFIHDNPAPATPTPTTSQATASPRGATSPRSSPSAPRQVCNIFWQSGACDRGFDCSFKHTRNPQATHTASRSAINSDEDPPDFYSIDGLVPDGRERTQRGSYDPAEVHNHIKPFLKDNYTFEGPRNIESFVRIISSINDHNKSWNTDNAQAFLSLLVKDNGITRIGEILRFKPVDDCTNVFRTSLSFQRGYFPILEYLSSSLVLKSTWHKNINHLYTVVEDNYDDLHAVVDSCMNSMIKRNSWRDPGSAANLDGANVFKTLTTVFLQYFNRFKSSIRNHPEIVNLVQHLTEWFDIWVAGVMTKSPVLFEDPITDLDPRRRGLIIDQIHDDINRLVTIVQRESDHATVLKRHTSRPAVTVAQRRNAEIMRLGQIYDPPGELRPEGPRHDNDSIDIADIRIAPTQNELLCEISPYLPAFLPEAQHHCLPDSMERHLDIQFRLLREELISTIRSSINAVYQDLREIWESPGQRRDTTKLEKLLSKGGGAYRTTGLDSVFFMIYANVGFAPVRAERRDLTVGLLIDPPAGAARDPQASKRVAYWKNSRRLQGGGLVALLVVSNKTLKVYLGVLASFGDDIAESSKASAEKVQVRITFFDPEVEFRALKREKLSGSSSSYAFLVDGSVMFEASRPFLERLQTIEPTEIPFGNYISSSNSLADVQVKPPRYATNPRFKYNLQCLAKDREHRISDLDITRPDAVNLARHQMLESSTLDPSQVDAVINTLTREVSLIQGPPGTGKSFTGREILRILFASKVRPIVLIAYTNHALDHLLREVLDVGITKRLVRLGSRSSDEVVAEYTLDKLEKLAERSSLQRSIGKQYAVMKRLEEDMSRVMESIQLPKVSAQQVEDHLDIHFPQALNVLLSPPFWISQLAETLWADEDTNGEWSTVRGKGKQQAGDVVSHTFYDFWKTGADIAFLAPVSMAHSPMPTPGKKKNRAAKSQGTTVLQEDPKVTRFFETLEFGNNRPQIPDQNRPLTRLRNSEDLWKMSLQERTRLALAWEEDIRVLAYNINLDRYNSLREDYKEACKEYNDIRDETRRRLLSSVDLIACTTTGAAKLTSLINSIAPRVLMVEEAGQVLEAHILTSLVNSIHHLICIGDPQQLRPSLATFGLSMDSERGKQLFKFDRSLMERLADSGLQMTQLNVQRRMRPTISHFIRRILYPNLEDHDIVKTYPSVRGMQKDVYFLNHIHPEGGSEDSVSKYNTYEVQMIRDLVLYFLKQDMYSGPGDIAVLCAYLGQLQKVRQALKDLKIAVSVDERDETQLLQQGLEEEGAFEEVVVAKHIRLGTVDIYQGQEAKIVIVSLVRNTGNYDTKSASIGFLKSSNRINVALSRAKHGMYIMGNASNLRKNTTWSTILDDLEDQGLIGQGFPIICARHPDQVNLISKPGDLGQYAPEGGCLLPCGYQLDCGHICPSVCHITLDNHRSMYCHEPCRKTPCPRGHPCPKECSENCGDCMFPIYDVTLPCSHTEKKVHCYLLEKLDSVKCPKLVTKKLPRCEHSALMPCSKDPASYICKEICGGIMGCCSKSCKSQCHQCQTATKVLVTGDPVIGHKSSPTRINRTSHYTHPCDRPLYCMHPCGKACHPKDNPPCNPACQQACRQECLHQKCKKTCSSVCPPCMEPCTWNCSHYTCPVTCGSICTRLPCDQPCREKLTCGHPCPSVCGEICNQQICVLCLETDKKQEVVDLVMQRRLDELDLSSDDISERLITLKCGHIFTVETLDGVCRMADFYEVSNDGTYIRTKAPPVEYQTPPTCPQCRSSITALRYGRVVKRSMLDILEQNVASNMSRDLELLGPHLEHVSKSLETFKERAKTITPDTTNLGTISQARKTDAIEKQEPISKALLDLNAMNSIHGLSPQETRIWNTIVKPILDAYSRAHSIATTQGAHVKAYEGAFSTLYRLELDTLINDPSVVTDAPEPMALRAVQMNIGQPPPTADSRFQIEAYIHTLELRFMLAQVGLARLDGLNPAATDELSSKDKRHWKEFIGFIYETCVADSRKALAIAEKSSASRRAATSKVFMIRSDFERIRFQTTIGMKSLKVSDPTFAEDRERIAQQVSDTRTSVEKQLLEYEREYIRSRPTGNNIRKLNEERNWFKENCAIKVQRFIDELNDLEAWVKNGTVYEPLSHNEMEDIVKAFKGKFLTTGHFYNCPNGHPFVITECGGAMQTSVCPECGEAIGGGSHRLLDTNTVDSRFEGILRDMGITDRGFY